MKEKRLNLRNRLSARKSMGPADGDRKKGDEIKHKSKKSTACGNRTHLNNLEGCHTNHCTNAV